MATLTIKNDDGTVRVLHGVVISTQEETDAIEVVSHGSATALLPTGTGTLTVTFRYTNGPTELAKETT
ncbi:hypothetical protein ACGYK5_17770 [Sulfitobacter sp. 1A16787]|uniref:hypothetical protein n=1 Tax=Sulfitobacter sp. 1A16787 TaxID=3368571 RepID=UPI0037473065